jgi:hypothetical protein
LDTVSRNIFHRETTEGCDGQEKENIDMHMQDDTALLVQIHIYLPNKTDYTPREPLRRISRKAVDGEATVEMNKG